ncbi:MAG: acyl carrier protein [Pirellulaceae bacterium]
MAAENAEPTKKSSLREVTADEVQDWIVDYLAKELDISPAKIDPRNTFDSFALDSATAIGMTGDLESWLGRRIDPTVVYDYPTIEEFSEYLANRS